MPWEDHGGCPSRRRCHDRFVTNVCSADQKSAPLDKAYNIPPTLPDAQGLENMNTTARLRPGIFDIYGDNLGANRPTARVQGPYNGALHIFDVRSRDILPT